MKIYKRNPLDIDLGGFERFLLPLLAILVIVFLAFMIFGGATNSIVAARLIQNPLSLTANDSTVLQVVVSNPTPQMAQNVLVQVSAPSAPQLTITPKKQTIPFLGTNEARTLEFLILPLDTKNDPFTPGSYSLKVATQLNGTPYEMQLQIQIIK